MKSLLIVDDDPMALKAMERMLYSMRNTWQMQFASSGEEALQLLAANPADVVISDMRMPGMSGAELMNEIMEHHPRTVRLILSGYSDAEMTMQCVGGTHQFITKPCSGEVLRSIIGRTLEMDHWVDKTPVKELVSRMTNIPSLPTVYFQILKALRSPDSSADDVGAAIARDPAMTAKVLHLANSAFFGLRQQMSDPTEAVIHLGLETIKSLVMSTHVFSELRCEKVSQPMMERVYQHCLATAGMARDIARLELNDRKLVDEAFTAGLLHDIGKLVLAANLPKQHTEMIQKHGASPAGLLEAERKTFGATHAEIGGYLLGLWGLPVSIIEAVAFHHEPSRCPVKSFTSLTAVHAANAFQHEGDAPHTGRELPGADEAYLAEAGVLHRIPLWRDAMAKHRQEGA